jgi:N-acetyl-gamma-glutamyl-phosphate reductase
MTPPLMVPIAIFGASGYVGAELLRLLAAHPGLRAERFFAESGAGETISRRHPQLSGPYPAARFERFSPGSLDGIGLVFAALPHGESQKIAPAILASGTPFVDLGADFRLSNPADYRSWYGEEHSAPNLLHSFAYGIPEINRAAIAGSKAVAAAGCYPTAAILALKPLIPLIESGTIIVDAASGVSGAGRGLKDETHFCTVDESFSAYGLLTHRHTAEMEQALGGPILFTPHLAPMNRGILATCYATAKGPCDPLAVLAEAYKDEPFVTVSERPPSTKWTLGSNAVHLTARYDSRTERVLAIAALDNLVKGAAGQMIQCANLMLGLEMGAGLPVAGMYP